MADFGLVIDEKPKNKKVKKSLKLRLSVGSSSDAQSYTSEKIEESEQQPEPEPEPEPLPEPYFEDLGSPSTRDAIAGMLSISQTEKLPAKLAVKASLKKKAAENNRIADEKINKVHQDEDFIYPTLDQSDDEDIPQTSQKDEAWNPKIKMSNLGPKMDRPVRESVKNVAIEKGLKNASEKRNNFVKIRPSGKIHKKSKNIPKPQLKNIDLDFSKDRNRTKKVGNTAKQRLGKILGLKF
eukprot:GFUD01026661.1.p1 GENE.GFUD01026661.1~~GFUD01026661.1.p1  ORF type:complete len:262 (+),score=70.94 GFUD01026661.1:75-788(+)